MAVQQRPTNDRNPESKRNRGFRWVQTHMRPGVVPPSTPHNRSSQASCLLVSGPLVTECSRQLRCRRSDRRPSRLSRAAFRPKRAGRCSA